MTQTTLMEFPCDFPIKIIGINSATFLDDIKHIAKKHFFDFSDQNLTSKISGKNNYLAITATVHATSQAMLDAFYQEVSKHPDIKMVL